MNTKLLQKCLLTMTILFCALADIQARNTNHKVTNLPGENVIFQWNRVLQETIRAGVHPSATIFPVRTYAMMHAAMFDAVNSIDGTYTPYLTEVPGSRNASMEAAAAQAAHDVLVGLYPTRRAIFDAELAAALNGIPQEPEQGIRVGQIVAAHILAARANDGWTVSPIPPYVLPPTPGNWQPTPPANAAATFTHYPNVLPFAVRNNTQFAPGSSYPALTSARYAADLNEVKLIGKDNSATRTAEQTQIARLWANVGTPTILFFSWNNVARRVSIERGLTTVENARLFALLNMAAHDLLLTSFTAKFQSGLWRPVTAIRRADEDGNAATEPDPTWLALLANPPYPSYPGNMAGIGMTHATVLTLFFGRDDIAFQNTWENGADGTGGATRSYLSFTQMAQEEADSRIYGGIHYRFDNEAGQAIGRNVANYVFLNVLKPRCNN